QIAWWLPRLSQGQTPRRACGELTTWKAAFGPTRLAPGRPKLPFASIKFGPRSPPPVAGDSFMPAQSTRPFPSFVARSTWHRAATLAERARSLRTTGLPRSAPPRDDERDRRRLERWREQAPFASDSHFHARLAYAGLTPE